MIVQKKPELLVTARNMEEVDLLINAGANALLISGGIYGLRTLRTFDFDMLREATLTAHHKKVKIYILMNTIVHNDLLSDLENYIGKIAAYNIDAIVFEDPAVFMVAKKINPELVLHLSSGTMVTNSEMINFWAKKGISRVDLARELSLDEVAYIKEKTNIEIQIQIHGTTSIFYSKRKLIGNYFKYLNRENTDSYLNDVLFLRERERPNEKYPVFEDYHGTHIMNDHDLCMIEYIDKFIELGIDSLKIDSILHSTDYLVKITGIYRKAIDKVLNNENISELYEQIKAIQPLNRQLGTGFYFKEQIY